MIIFFNENQSFKIFEYLTNENIQKTVEGEVLDSLGLITLCIVVGK